MRHGVGRIVAASICAQVIDARPRADALVDERQIVGGAGDGEHALHRLGPAAQPESAAVARAALMSPQEGAQARGVDEAQIAQVDDDLLGGAVLHETQLLAELVDRAEVELAVQDEGVNRALADAVDGQTRHRDIRLGSRGRLRQRTVVDLTKAGGAPRNRPRGSASRLASRTPGGYPVFARSSQYHGASVGSFAFPALRRTPPRGGQI